MGVYQDPRYNPGMLAQKRTLDLNKTRHSLTLLVYSFKYQLYSYLQLTHPTSMRFLSIVTFRLPDGGRLEHQVNSMYTPIHIEKKGAPLV